MISVIIPLYNKQDCILKTIDSVLTQSYEDVEVIVVDDGSVDDSGAIVKSIGDSRVKYYYKPNGGVSSARNYGIAKSNGDWFMFLDADDEIMPEALSVFEQLMESYPKCDFFVGQTKWQQKGTEIKKHKGTRKTFYTHSPFFTIWRDICCPGTRNMLIHRSLIQRFGEYDERMSFFEDWEFSLRMARCGSFVCTDKTVGVYNQNSDGLSMSKHLLEKEMAYYIPEMLKGSTFFERALFYENIEFEKFCWRDEPDKVKFYEDMQRKYFSRIHALLHWFRQKFIA